MPNSLRLFKICLPQDQLKKGKWCSEWSTCQIESQQRPKQRCTSFPISSQHQWTTFVKYAEYIQFAHSGIVHLPSLIYYHVKPNLIYNVKDPPTFQAPWPVDSKTCFISRPRNLQVCRYPIVSALWLTWTTCSAKDTRCRLMWKCAKTFQSGGKIGTLKMNFRLAVERNKRGYGGKPVGASWHLTN